jgi:hypothetical protein
MANATNMSPLPGRYVFVVDNPGAQVKKAPLGALYR